MVDFIEQNRTISFVRNLLRTLTCAEGSQVYQQFQTDLPGGGTIVSTSSDTKASHITARLAARDAAGRAIATLTVRTSGQYNCAQMPSLLSEVIAQFQSSVDAVYGAGYATVSQDTAFSTFSFRVGYNINDDDLRITFAPKRVSISSVNDENNVIPIETWADGVPLLST